MYIILQTLLYLINVHYFTDNNQIKLYSTLRMVAPLFCGRGEDVTR